MVSKSMMMCDKAGKVISRSLSQLEREQVEVFGIYTNVYHTR